MIGGSRTGSVMVESVMVMVVNLCFFCFFSFSFLFHLVNVGKPFC